MIRVEQWWFSRYSPNGAFTAPECTVPVICGQIFGSTGIPEGGNGSIAMNRIVGTRGDMLVSISGNEYKLGEPKPEYEKAYPNAKERILRMCNAR